MKKVPLSFTQELLLCETESYKANSLNTSVLISSNQGLINIFAPYHHNPYFWPPSLLFIFFLIELTPYNSVKTQRVNGCERTIEKRSGKQKIETDIALNVLKIKRH